MNFIYHPMNKLLYILLLLGLPDLLSAADTLQIAQYKTIHLAFNKKIIYCDLGAAVILAGKADGAENILRVKATQPFNYITNFSVITEGPDFYTFMAQYDEDPAIYFYDYRTKGNTPEVRSVDTSLVHTNDIFERISNKKRALFHIGQTKYKLELSCDNIIIDNDKTYLILSLSNKSNISYNTASVKLFTEGKEKAKREVSQFKEIPIFSQFGSLNSTKDHSGKLIISLEKLTLTDNQILSIRLYEESGNRHLSFSISSIDFTNAQVL